VEALPRGELDRYDAKTKAFVPYFGGISAQDVAFSKDGQWVAYVSFREGTLWRSRADGSDKLQLSFPPTYAAGPRWSPDGKEIAFSDVSPGKPWHIYLVPAGGGPPQELMSSDTGPEADPTWSPDGGSIAFASVSSKTDIRVFDMKTHQVSTLPGSQGLYSSRWSPDGRYLVAMPFNPLSLRLYDFKAREWSLLASVNTAYPSFSGDSKYVYFLGRQTPPAILRVRIRDRKLEQVVSLKGFHLTGYWGEWLGLAPDDSPLLLKDAGTQEIVSMDWHEP